MKKRTTRFNKLKIRLKTCWNILFRNYDHWMLINIDRENLLNLLRNDGFDTEISYHGLQPYVCLKIVKNIADNVDFSEMILEKAIFEAKSENFKNKKNGNS